MSMTDKTIQYILFVTPNSPKSTIAHNNLLKLCEPEQIQVVDIMENPEQIMRHDVLATPTVIRTIDSLTIVGTLNDLKRTASLLGLDYSKGGTGGEDG